MLDSLFHKHKPVDVNPVNVTTFADGGIFQKIFKTKIGAKIVGRYHFYLGITMMRL